MAKIVAAFLRNSGAFVSCNSTSLTKIYLPSISSVRTLYAQSTLGIDGYIQTREKTKSQFSNMSEKFRTKMSEYVSNEDPKSMIFTEDLKNMVHLAESNDVSLVTNMMKKFNMQNKELRFGSFVFGPVVMRMFYFLNKPNEALECFTSPELEGFFDQLMSYQLLLDLLYENGCYDDVIKTFNIIKERQIRGTKYPRNIVVLVMASCYKKNNQESLTYALNLWKELNEVGHLPMRRAATFCAGLALNLGKPEAALEIVGSIKKQNYVTVRNIRAVALAEIGRLEDVIPILRSVLEIDNPENKKHTFTKDIMERIHTAFKKQDKLDVSQEYQRIEKVMLENGHITNDTLDNQLCSEIEAPQFVNANDRNQMYQPNRQRNRYDGKRSGNFKVFQQRPGLKDMY